MKFPFLPQRADRHGVSFFVLLLALTGLLPACSTVATPKTPVVMENSLGMKFVRVPAGEFLMGSDEALASLVKDYPHYAPDRLMSLTDEAPVHRVRLSSAFFLGQHEVTVGQFSQFLEASGYVPESVADGTGGYGYNPDYDPSTTQRGDAFEGRNPKYSWRNPGFVQSKNDPVLNVTWHDAVAMARWLSQREGKTYRLPTEAEWEYACRAGSQTRHASGSGSDPQSLARVANTFDADAATHWPQWKPFALKEHDGYAFTAPVGSFAPNAFGLYDMLGNAWEWVADRYQEDYYADSPVQDPQGPQVGAMRVRRGGSWHTWSLYARCTYRNINTESSRYPLLGMRLLREVGPDDLK